MRLLKTSDRQFWIWHLFTSHWVLEVFFCKCGKWFAHRFNFHDWVVYNFWFQFYSACFYVLREFPAALSVHRAPGEKAAVPIYKVLVRPAERRTLDLPALKRTHLPLGHGLVTYSEWNNISDVNRTATSEQSWRHKDPMPRRKQSTQAKQLTARNKNALTRVTLQENKTTPNRTWAKEQPWRKQAGHPDSKEYSLNLYVK